MDNINMAKGALIVSIVGAAGALIGLIPCVGWLNYFVIPICIAGIIVSSLAQKNDNATEQDKKYGKTGMIISIVALVISVIRFIFGGFMGI